MKKLPLIRWINVSAFALSVVLLTLSAYLQFGLGLEPCALCIIQRIALFVLALLYLLGALYKNVERWWIKLHGFLVLAVSGFGALVAGRQVWLMSLPIADVPPCLPQLVDVWENLPFMRVVELLFKGSADCTKDTMPFLGLTIPQWSLLFFSIFFLLALLQVFKNWGPKPRH